MTLRLTLAALISMLSFTACHTNKTEVNSPYQYLVG